ncbi:MAG: hypothetical protein Kow0069_04720 [Promethearchaeota archaeon]
MGTFEDLCQAAQSADGNAREWAAFELGELGDPRAESVLVALLRDENKWVVEKAVYALQKLGAKGAVEEVRQVLRRESNPRVKTAAQRFLLEFDEGG